MLDEILNTVTGKSAKSNRKKSTKKTSALDPLLDSADKFVKQKLPKGGLSDMVQGALDGNKDGRIADDLLKVGENLLKSKTTKKKK